MEKEGRRRRKEKEQREVLEREAAKKKQEETNAGCPQEELEMTVALKQYHTVAARVDEKAARSSSPLPTDGDASPQHTKKGVADEVQLEKRSAVQCTAAGIQLQPTSRAAWRRCGRAQASSLWQPAPPRRFASSTILHKEALGILSCPLLAVADAYPPRCRSSKGDR